MRSRVDWLFAKWAFELALEPIFETSRMEVMSLVALELGDLVIVLKSRHANDAVIHVLCLLIYVFEVLALQAGYGVRIRDACNHLVHLSSVASCGSKNAAT